MFREEFYKIDEEDFLIAKYKWEFVRRNKFYRRDYKNIWLPVLKKNSTRKALRVSRYFQRKYGLFEPRSPYLPSPECKKGRGKNFAWLFPSDAVWCKDLLCDALPKNRKRIKKGFDKIHLEIDMRFPKERIMKSVEETINNCLAILPKKYKDVNSRKRFSQYEGYLKIFDLRNKGCSWNQLAEKFYKNDIDRNELNYAKRKAKRDYERCAKLVESGFRQIR